MSDFEQYRRSRFDRYRDPRDARVGPHPADLPEDRRREWSDMSDDEQEAIVKEFLNSQPDGQVILREATSMMLEHIAEEIVTRRLNKGWVI